MSITNLYHIADCIGLNLKVKSKSVTGKLTKKLPLCTRYKLSVGVQVKASFLNDHKQQAGILTHIKGNVYLATMYNGSTDTLSNWLIDGSLVGHSMESKTNLFSDCKTIRECCDYLSHGLIKMWSTNVADHETMNDWKKIKIP